MIIIASQTGPSNSIPSTYRLNNTISVLWIADSIPNPAVYPPTTEILLIGVAISLSSVPVSLSLTKEIPEIMNTKWKAL